ncbi:nucleotidyltransferase AbiEii toxin of type IV toxin-antitoxin system [Fluviicoccus keumensis]|uniref:Nucleotidyltransferase AbiEii toxin of type IV toxin-antitoxin system n=1 Tax=Fluviicoccus keumensis TaxID=1435465 RepID=A0A4Q7Z9C0_9GAMM|nr:nucleotidyl transferase AbiEii/AbiGii toxin family protein [Fluviicoccus keumensis]RZU47137.1 nucleotidyltransferase AbiEii toxin of type IV toxin-antitoxin system [Fluviicoccus keumensis]
MSDFLHNHSDFSGLLAIVADERGIDPVLVEKDYWIMHCLWGLQALQFRFELKGCTSLSKGFGVIHRFSEDIDIRIEPPDHMQVKVGKNHDKPAHIESRRYYYEWLARNITIPGIDLVERDTAFDDEKMRSAGIRLRYPNRVGQQSGIKDGILLELGFDDTTPNWPVVISSWAYEAAVKAGVPIFDNRAVDVPCYQPAYTFVEKLQTVSTKYRLQKAGEAFPANFMRHYYDIYCLLTLPEVQEFIGTPAYEARKVQRFRSGDELIAAKNPAFLLDDPEERERFSREYRRTSALYYNGQPDLTDILCRIGQFLDKM